MKKLNFANEDAFLTALAGKVYAVANATNTGWLCDILEEDYVKFTNEGKIVDLTISTIPALPNHYHDVYVQEEYQDEVLAASVEICITK